MLRSADTPSRQVNGSRGPRPRCEASPDLVDVENVSVLRKLCLRGTFTDERFATALTHLQQLDLELVPTLRLLPRAFELRATSAATTPATLRWPRLGCELITADVRLATATGPRWRSAAALKAPRQQGQTDSVLPAVPLTHPVEDGKACSAPPRFSRFCVTTRNTSGNAGWDRRTTFSGGLSADRLIADDGYSWPMDIRVLGRTGRPVSVVGLGTWQIGGDWGDVQDSTAFDILGAAVEAGVTLFDTADVYGDGHSEQLIGRFLRDRPDVDVLVATKMGRRAEQLAENYVLSNFREWNDRSRRNLGLECLDLVQLHCPPTPVYGSDEVYDALDTMVDEGRIANYGVSVETVAQALAAIARPRVASIQIVLNAFRQKPLDQVVPAAARNGVGILARVPLASGLLSGRYRRDTTFAENDHRNFNRGGEAFDVGETFAGIDFEAGVDAAQEFAALAPEHPAALALRWIIDQPGVTAVIPGARSVEQVRSNAAAAGLSGTDSAIREKIRDLYDRRIRPSVHSRW